MLAPHVVEGMALEAGAADEAAVAGAALPRETKMVALVVDPAVIGDEPVAHVRPGEIPAYRPPVPIVSAQVPDYRRVREINGPGTAT
jgi:hypothetical protein